MSSNGAFAWWVWCWMQQKPLEFTIFLPLNALVSGLGTGASACIRSGGWRSLPVSLGRSFLSFHLAGLELHLHLQLGQRDGAEKSRKTCNDRNDRNLHFCIKNIYIDSTNIQKKQRSQNYSQNSGLIDSCRRGWAVCSSCWEPLIGAPW